MYHQTSNLLPGPPKHPLPKNVIRGTIACLIWKVVVLILWSTLGMYRSKYYSFGPSDSLYLAFVDVAIDTPVKYAAIMCYIVAECALKVYSGDLVYPWINTVVMNPGVEVPHDLRIAYAVTNLYWGVNCFNTIFFFALGFAQVDFALAIGMTSLISGMVTSYIVVFDPERPHAGGHSKIANIDNL